VLNIPFFIVFHIIDVAGYNLRLHVSGYHIYRCGL